EPGVADPFHARVARQVTGDHERVLGVLDQPQGQRLQPLQELEGVEGREGGAEVAQQGDARLSGIRRTFTSAWASKPPYWRLLTSRPTPAPGRHGTRAADSPR